MLPSLSYADASGCRDSSVDAPLPSRAASTIRTRNDKRGSRPSSLLRDFPESPLPLCTDVFYTSVHHGRMCTPIGRIHMVGTEVPEPRSEDLADGRFQPAHRQAKTDLRLHPRKDRSRGYGPTVREIGDVSGSVSQRRHVPSEGARKEGASSSGKAARPGRSSLSTIAGRRMGCRSSATSPPGAPGRGRPGGAVRLRRHVRRGRTATSCTCAATR